MKMRLFKIIGCSAHQRPGTRLEFSRIVYARDIAHALKIYRWKLKGVKTKNPSGCPVMNRYDLLDLPLSAPSLRSACFW